MAVKDQPIELRWAQGEVFKCDKRFRVLVAGRRFGKSYLACVELLRGALNRPGETFFYCAPTYRMAKDIAWRALKKLVPKVWIQSKNETDLRIELINGSTIELKGTENAMALRGRSLSGVVLDEAAFMEPEVWFEVIRPALADKEGWALFISTPDGTASWFYDLWCYVPEDETEGFMAVDGVIRRLMEETSASTRSKQPALSLIRARSARNLKRRSRTSPDWLPSASPTTTSPRCEGHLDPAVAARR